MIKNIFAVVAFGAAFIFSNVSLSVGEGRNQEVPKIEIGEVGGERELSNSPTNLSPTDNKEFILDASMKDKAEKIGERDKKIVEKMDNFDSKEENIPTIDISWFEDFYSNFGGSAKKEITDFILDTQKSNPNTSLEDIIYGLIDISLDYKQLRPVVYLLDRFQSSISLSCISDELLVGILCMAKIEKKNAIADIAFKRLISLILNYCDEYTYAPIKNLFTNELSNQFLTSSLPLVVTHMCQKMHFEYAARLLEELSFGDDSKLIWNKLYKKLKADLLSTLIEAVLINKINKEMDTKIRKKLGNKQKSVDFVPSNKNAINKKSNANNTKNNTKNLGDKKQCHKTIIGNDKNSIKVESKGKLDTKIIPINSKKYDSDTFGKDFKAIPGSAFNVNLKAYKNLKDIQNKRNN